MCTSALWKHGRNFTYWTAQGRHIFDTPDISSLAEAQRKVVVYLQLITVRDLRVNMQTSDTYVNTWRIQKNNSFWHTIATNQFTL